MLKQRILTALILVPLTLLLMFYSSPLVFLSVTALITLAGVWEWSNLMGLKKTSSRLFYLILTVLFSSYLVFSASIFKDKIFTFTLIIFGGAFIWWLLAALLIVRYPRASAWWGYGVIVRGFMGFFVLFPCWAAINYIRNSPDGSYSLLFLFVLISGADTFAYFTGKKWGKNKLAPKVSPGKSWQGLFGAVVGSLCISLIALWLCSIPFAIWPYAIVLSFITVIFSVVGDLFESMMKRQIGVKDSGKILPGHGGLLDRIDSLTAAAPIFVFGGLLFGMMNL